MTSRRRCAACKYLRRKCPQDCIFYPYFPSNDPQRFACVHKIYGAKNVAKTLQDVPEECRGEAVESMHIEAQHRIEDPVYGCVRTISQLHQDIQMAETQLAKTRAEIAININFLHQDHHQPRHRDVIPDHQGLESNDQSDLNDLNRLVLQGQQIGGNFIEQSHYSHNSNQGPWNI